MRNYRKENPKRKIRNSDMEGGQKVEPFFKRCAKKWSTFHKSASKSGAPMKILGVLGDFAPNWMHFVIDIQNAYLAKDT